MPKGRLEDRYVLVTEGHPQLNKAPLKCRGNRHPVVPQQTSPPCPEAPRRNRVTSRTSQSEFNFGVMLSETYCLLRLDLHRHQTRRSDQSRRFLAGSAAHTETGTRRSDNTVLL
ncbi:hypothetical protein ElyMa_006444700 [Elysia marginata]|uniref:Uncharacterized protein n=1 Tax=Elysia marginata TaxID=1093978 RepID=A0AAV4HW57_9GAST|nr:hypothetical protein ElyMa_006444700 [Elysia marginata]